MQHTAPRRPMAAGALTTLGGILTLVSSFLIWGRVTALADNSHRDVKGGNLVLIAGIVLIAIGLLLLLVRSRGFRLVLAIVTILVGLAAVLIAGVSAGSKDVFLTTVADKIGDEQGVSHSQAEKFFKDAEKRGDVKVQDQLGVFLALGGGVVALIGGIAGLRRGKREELAPPPPPPGAAWPAQPSSAPVAPPVAPEGTAPPPPPPPSAPSPPPPPSNPSPPPPPPNPPPPPPGGASG